MFDRTGCNAPIQSILQIATQQSMNQTRSEGITRTQSVNNFNLISASFEDLAFLIRHAGPCVTPDQRVFPQGDRNDVKFEFVCNLRCNFFVVGSSDAKHFLNILFGGDKHIAILHQIRKAITRFGSGPKLDPVIQIHAGFNTSGFCSHHGFACSRCTRCT